MTDRPRWRFFAWFAVVAAAHLAIEGWTGTTAIGLPVGFAVTLALVFVRRVPWWATGEAGPGGRRGVKVVAFVVLWLLVAAAIVAGLVEHPPHGRDVWYAALFVAIFLGATLFGLVRLRPKRPATRRAALWRRLAFATATVWVAGVLFLGIEVATILVTGGWLPWVLPIPAVLVVLGLAGWRSDLAGPARCLASGAWTPVAAAALDVRPGEPVDGWAVLPGDVRIKFHLPAAPADVAAELVDRRRLWLAGWPSDELVVGLPDGDSYAVGLIGVHRGGGKTRLPARRAAGSVPAVTTVQQTFPVPPQVLWNALPAGVAAIRGKQPVYDGPRGFATCRTGISLLSWGQHVNVTVSPVNGGSTLTIMTVLKLGVFDWGEGKRLARRYAAAVAHAVGTAALT